MEEAKTSTLICYTCRHHYGILDFPIIFPVYYDFCPSCRKLMVYDFERQLIGLPAAVLSELKKKRLRLEEKPPP